MAGHRAPFIRTTAAVLVTLLSSGGWFAASAQSPAAAQDAWPQFRGPGGSGVSANSAAPPTEFGPATNLLWKTALPTGHSSAAVWGNRVFVTAFDQARKMLEVIGLDRTTGAILWRRDVPVAQLETVHAVSSPATATPAVDGEQVYVYFGSYGVLAYDLDGKDRWAAPMPLAAVPFGSGTSPVVAGNLVIVNRHAPKDAFLVALDRKTGAVAWKVTHEVPPGLRVPFGSHSTPLVIDRQVVISGPTTIAAYDLSTGTRQWWVAVLSSASSTPTIAGETIYAATWTPFGEADQRHTWTDFAVLLRDHDADKNGVLSREEIPPDLKIASRPDAPDVPGATITVQMMFNRFDGNKDGAVDSAEWEAGRQAIAQLSAEHGLLAIRTGGTGDVTATHVRWSEKSSIPEVPSPIYHGERVYMVRNGGILTCLDAASGKVVYRARVGAPGPYYASPVVAGGKLYLASGDGVVTVLGTGPSLEVLARNDLGEPVLATPAVAGGVLYVRTASGLSAFGQRLSTE